MKGEVENQCTGGKQPNQCPLVHISWDRDDTLNIYICTAVLAPVTKLLWYTVTSMKRIQTAMCQLSPVMYQSIFLYSQCLYQHS